MDQLKAAPPQEAKLHFLDYWRIIRIRKTVILAVFLLVVITATLVTLILPQSYSSTAQIKIERDISDINPIGNAQSLPGVYDPYFIQTEFAVIKSEIILDSVIEKLDLNREWGKKYANGDRLKTSEARGLLQSRLDLRPVRNTLLIEIQVYSENPQEASNLANKIAKAYSDYRLEKRRKLTLGGIKSLEDRFNMQQDRVREAQEKVDQLRNELKIPDAMIGGNGPQQLFSAQELSHFNSLRIESEKAYVTAENLLNQLKSLSREDLKKAMPTVYQDTQLNAFLQDLSLAEQRLIALQKDYAPDHPIVQNAEKIATDLKQKINDRLDGILIGMKSQVDSMKAGLDALVTRVETAKSNDIAAAQTTAPYFAAKQNLERVQRFSDILNFKIQQEYIDMNLPKSTMVETVTHATPGAKPVRPNRTLNIILGVVIGLVVGIGLAFFIEYLDTSVKTIDDVERTLQAPVLGVIPQNVGILLREGADSPHAEAYRVLRTNLLFSRKDDKLNTIAIVSAGAGEGKSTTVFNLAAVFTQSGNRVLIVDSDLRRPTLHKMLGITNNLGLTNYLLKQNTLEEVIQTSPLPGLDFMASGKLPSSSLGILSSAQMKDLITQLKLRYDFVFFDSPPIMGVSDASILASEVDMTLQVIQYRRYPQPMNIRAKQMIEKVGGNLVGIVLNNINMAQDESYYYYSGYYHEYYSKNEEETPGAARESKPAGSDAAKLEIKQKY